ncbi:MAG TPA: hypothetical protein PLH37_01015 [bacterium]|nr:hypothetical protein [bacterium]
MREKIIDKDGQYCLDFTEEDVIKSTKDVRPPEEKSADGQPTSSIDNTADNTANILELDRRGRKISRCPRCGGILHGGAPCEK